MKKEILTIVAATVAFIAPAGAEDFTAGKTPAQLFRSDCSGCHAQPAGLLKRRRDIGDLTGFLREHYTTKSESAAALATYLAGFPTASATGRVRPRNHSEQQDGPAVENGAADAEAKSPGADPAESQAADSKAAQSDDAEPKEAGSRSSGHKASGHRASRHKGATPQEPAAADSEAKDGPKAADDTARQHHRQHRRTHKNAAAKSHDETSHDDSKAGDSKSDDNKADGK